jgi:hypothetical protein
MRFNEKLTIFADESGKGSAVKYHSQLNILHYVFNLSMPGRHRNFDHSERRLPGEFRPNPKSRIPTFAPSRRNP